MSAARARRQIGLLRSLATRAGLANVPVTIGWFQRARVITLWRRGLVDVWYRQRPDTQPALQGPYFSLSVAGFQLARAFLQPRGEGR